MPEWPIEYRREAYPRKEVTMSINAVALSPSTPALLPQFTSSSAPQRSTQTAASIPASPSDTADRVTLSTAAPTASAPPATTAASNTPPPAASSAPSNSAANLPASLVDNVGSFVYTINGQSYSTTISSSGGEYSATVPGVGTISEPSEAAVEAAISVRISALA